MEALYGRPTLLIFGKQTKRDENTSGLRIQNIYTALTIADLVRTNLGPLAMYKMLMDPMGGVVMTNDGNAILREIIVQHPVAKMLIEIARTQDEEVGDGTTSVVVLCGQILAEVERNLDSFHPVLIIRELRRALADILSVLPEMSKTIDTTDKNEMISIAKACLGTKFLNIGWSDMLCEMSMKAIDIVRESNKEQQRIDLKSYVRIIKLPGGTIEETQLVNGVVLDKDILHPDMRRFILNPRILILCTPLEYRKGESVTNAEITTEEGFTRLLEIEEEYIADVCKIIASHKPDLVLTEKGISDLAIHYLAKAGISALRRVKKMDLIRLARVCGATIVSRPEEINEIHIGIAGKFEVKLIGDEYFSLISDCNASKACTLFLRGPSKDILHEMERNLQDILSVLRNIYLEPKVVAGGGAVEMQLYRRLSSSAEDTDLESSSPYHSVINALKVIPRTLLQNSGTSPLRAMNELESRLNTGETLAVNGLTGQLVSPEELNVWESVRVKAQLYKSAIETAIHILKIDEIVSGTKSKGKELMKAQKEEMEKKHKEIGQGDSRNDTV